MRTRVGLLTIALLPVAAIAQDGPPTIHVGPIVPPAFRLLAEPAVQKEINLNGAQAAAADQVRRSWTIPPSGVWFGYIGLVPAEPLRAAANQRTADFMARTLTKEQRTRLDQIVFQLREKEFGPHYALAMAARDLGLRADQLEDVGTLKALRVEEIAKVVTSGKRFEKVKQEVQAANGDTYERMAEMLTRGQRERLGELRGKAFAGAVDPTRASVEPPPAQYSATNVGFYDLELTYAITPAVKAELNLSDDQVKALSDAWDKASEGQARGRIPKGWVDLVHAATEKALSDHLTKEQRARFDQIMMQRRARVSPEAACTYPAAISTLKLTPIQLQQFSAGKRLRDVLSEDQLAKHRQLLGEPFELPAVRDDYIPALVDLRTLAPPRARARDFLILTNRLGLTDEQVKKLRELAEDEPKIRELIQKELALDDTPPVAGAARLQTATNAVSEQYGAAVEQQCWDTLTPPQQSLARKFFARR